VALNERQDEACVMLVGEDGRLDIGAVDRDAGIGGERGGHGALDTAPGPAAHPLPHDFAMQLDSWQRRMEAALARRLPAVDLVPTRLHQAMRYSALAGGKRVRPALLFASARASGVAEEQVEAAEQGVHQMSYDAGVARKAEAKGFWGTLGYHLSGESWTVNRQIEEGSEQLARVAKRQRQLTEAAQRLVAVPYDQRVEIWSGEDWR